MLISRRGAIATAFALKLSQSQAQVTPATGRLLGELEPLVTLYEHTDRSKCPELLSSQMRSGMPHVQLMSAVFLAGVRNVNPRPPGYAMHCVFLIHSAHQLSLQCPATMRHLPMYFALDQFKESQAKDAAEKAGDYRMTELTGSMPSPQRALPELIRGLEGWNPDVAERAAAVASRYSAIDKSSMFCGPIPFGISGTLGTKPSMPQTPTGP